MKNYRLLIMVLLAVVYITVDGQLLDSRVDSVGNTEFLTSQTVIRIIDLPADRLLILTNTVIHIISLRISADGAAGNSSDHIQLANVSHSNRFKDAILLNDTHLVLTSVLCLKAVIISNGDSHTYAGNCSEYGTKDGPLLEATFFYPNSMLMIQQTIYVLSSQYTPIRLVSGEQVSSLPLNDVNGLAPLSMFSCVGSYLYITFLNGLAQLDLADNSHVVLSGSTDTGFKDSNLNMSEFSRPYGLVMLGRDIILVADHDNNRLRIIDRSSDSVQSVCDGLRRSSDGNFTVCSFFNPFSIHLYKNLLLIGEMGNIRIIQRRLIVVDAVFNEGKCPDVRGDHSTTDTTTKYTNLPTTNSTGLPTTNSNTSPSQTMSNKSNNPMSKTKSSSLIRGILVAVVLSLV